MKKTGVYLTVFSLIPMLVLIKDIQEITIDFVIMFGVLLVTLVIGVALIYYG